jgi:cellulose synthase/poly-beta-1,6-N-acetylglucosamine synthase-like glycosyltransferase
MSIIGYFVLTVYTLALVYITVYCVMQFSLLYHYKKKGKEAAAKAPEKLPRKAHRKVNQMALASDDAFQVSSFDDFSMNSEEESESDLPFVTVQLPIYNEKYVIERLIEAVVDFDYPKSRYEIHILDDSTDDTVDIVRKRVAYYKEQGYQIEQVIRKDRKGFKAGALKDAMPLARGEFIAIFDADFLPRPDFLLQTVPYFEDEKVGVVQTRWEHINEDYSLITRLQAMQLNVHFTVEQKGRQAGNFLLQFNGTAGLWRRETIEDAGGWEADTLTEDLDLSYRAQLKGWKIEFLEHIGSPAELPAEMNSLKSQQFRWMKGGAETARKMLPTVWKSGLSFFQKMQASIHLLSSSIFVFVFLAGVFSVPLLFFLGDLIEMGFNKDFFAYFMVGLLSVIAVYYVANVEATHQDESLIKSILKFVFLFPLFLALSMGLSLHNTVAVIQGYLGKKSPFVRTPKFNIKNITDTFAKNQYVTRKISWTTIIEGLLAVYFTAAVIGAVYVQNTTFMFYHLLLAIGFGGIFIYTLRHLSIK